MTDRPILFSAPMVRALLAGTKTQTRRTAGVPAIEQNPGALTHIHNRHGGTFALGVKAQDIEAVAAGYLPIQPGDRLWVRETWRTDTAWDGYPPRDMEAACREAGYEDPWGPVEYDADKVRVNWRDSYKPGKTRVSIHMPRWASRLTLDATEARVQRLQDIGADDAIAEGIECRDGFWGIYAPDGRMICGGSPDPVEAYRCLWLNINGAGSWEANPWVAAYTFTVEHANIDALASPSVERNTSGENNE